MTTEPTRRTETAGGRDGSEQQKSVGAGAGTVAIASAAVTIAIGVTIASLTGHLGPAMQVARTGSEADIPAPVPEPIGPAAEPAQIVLVPVEPSPALADESDAPGARRAAWSDEQHDDEEHEEDDEEHEEDDEEHEEDDEDDEHDEDGDDDD